MKINITLDIDNEKDLKMYENIKQIDGLINIIDGMLKLFEVELYQGLGSYADMVHSAFKLKLLELIKENNVKLNL